MQEIALKVNHESLTIIDAMHNWLSGEPVWTHKQIITRWPNLEMYRARWMRNDFALKNLDKQFDLRFDYIKQFGFMIPCAELLDKLGEMSPIIEIGAGSGYMTALMRHRGIDVIGTNPTKGETYGFKLASYDHNQLSLQGKSAVRRFRDRTVFCSWPSLNETWFRQALQTMHIGQHLIVIREDACAEDTAWAYIDKCFTMEYLEIPTFDFINDIALVGIKKRQVKKASKP